MQPLRKHHFFVVFISHAGSTHVTGPCQGYMPVKKTCFTRLPLQAGCTLH